MSSLLSPRCYLTAAISSLLFHCCLLQVILTGDAATRAATFAQLKYNVRDWIARFGNLEFAHIANYVPLATPNVYPGYAALSYVNDPVYVSYMKQLLGNFQTASVGQ